MGNILIWLKSTGLTNLAYIFIGVASLLLGFDMAAGASFGIFGYVNYNAISKIIRDKIDSGD